MPRFANLISDLKRLFQYDLWDRDISALPRMKRFMFSSGRVLTIVFRSFVRDGCALHASALTYFTLMSMVPVLAMMVWFAKGVGGHDELMDLIGLRYGEAGTMEVVAGSRLSEFGEDVAEVPIYILSAVERANFGALGAVGLLLLIWSAIKALSRVENSFNIIWGVKEARSFLRKFSDYLSVLIIVPLLIMAATSINAFLSVESSDKSALESPSAAATSNTGEVQAVAGSEAGEREMQEDHVAASENHDDSIAVADTRPSLVDTVIDPLYVIYARVIRFFALIALIGAFSFLYAFIPNTRVRFIPALLGGTVGGIVWYLAQWIYIEGQIGLTKYNAVYGTFAAIPFFLVWLYVNWLLILFGAEVSFAIQHHKTFIMEFASNRVSQATKELLALVVVYDVCAQHHNGKSWSANEFSTHEAVPARLLSDVVQLLVDAGILLSVGGENNCYLPARDIDQLSFADIEIAFRGRSDPLLAHNGLFSTRKPTLLFQQKYGQFLEQLQTQTFRKLIESSPD